MKTTAGQAGDRVGPVGDFRGRAPDLLWEREGAWTAVLSPSSRGARTELVEAMATPNVGVQKPVYHLSLSAEPRARS